MMTFDETTSTLADGDEIMASRMIEREMESMREASYFRAHVQALAHQSFCAVEP